jgi:hypothetical protein
MRRYCIVFRKGGTENFKWHRSASMTEAEAIKSLEEEKRAGRPSSMMVDYDLSMSIGLPETFDCSLITMLTGI